MITKVLSNPLQGMLQRNHQDSFGQVECFTAVLWGEAAATVAADLQCEAAATGRETSRYEIHRRSPRTAYHRAASK